MDVSMRELREEIDAIKKSHPQFKDDAAFVFWFLKAYLVDSDDVARGSLTGKEGGRSGEKNLDAVYIDDRWKQCYIVQGKFHSSEKYSEKRNDVIGFADLALLPCGERTELDTFYQNLDPSATKKFKEVVAMVKNKDYSLNLFYVTTGKCTKTIIDDAREHVRQSRGDVNIRIMKYEDIMLLLRNYLEDITPAVPILKIRISSEAVVRHEGIVRRHDPETGIESWVFTACGKDIGDMYTRVGRRLFAKNIRGYLGKTDINESMEMTVKKEPKNFWYYNNGVTIVCDNARREVEGGQDILIIEGAQVINGQQTTITLSDTDASRANVLVKVIHVPRLDIDKQDYDTLVNAIVKATNWQNKIFPSDLISNDSIQIFLEKEFRKIGYQYIRKKMSKTEARSLYGQGYIQIDKKELAQAVAACIFEDPVIVRKAGKEGLFEDPRYKSIFGSKNVHAYLSKYWLMKNIERAGRGYARRSYAKWLVLNFMWRLIERGIGSVVGEKHFRCACERKNQRVLRLLFNTISDVFKAAMAFYRMNRGEGEEAKDESSFFQLSKLHIKFSEFWKTKNNRYRVKVKENLERFRNALEDENLI